jgi:hypothetical protein
MLRWGSGRPTEAIIYERSQTDLSGRISRIGRVISLAILVAVLLCVITALNGRSDAFEPNADPSEKLQIFPESDAQLSQSLIHSIFYPARSDLSGYGKEISHGPAYMPEHSKLKIVPSDESTKLWDLPEIKRYQVLPPILLDFHFMFHFHQL